MQFLSNKVTGTMANLQRKVMLSITLGMNRYHELIKITIYILLVVLEVMRYLGLVAEVNVHHLCSDLGLWPWILLFFPGFCKAYRGFLSGNLQNQPNILHHIILICFCFLVEEETALYLVTDY